VPVIKDRWLPDLLRRMQRQNAALLAEIIVIDNGGGIAKPICDQFPGLPIRYLPQTQNLGVNGSWNLGLATADNEHTAILNDDLELPDAFLDNIAAALKIALVALVVPNTIQDPAMVGCTGSLPFLEPLPQREGWAFSIKKSLAAQIPTSLFTFCGDDWLYQVVQEQQKWAVKDMNCRIFHHVGISTNLAERKALNLPPYREQELPTWHGIKAQHGW
jgi:hypothetical protein